MPPRASWKGFLNLSLVSVPVKAYTATSSGGQIRLNQLHSTCNSRIKQQTYCPICGEIPRDQILKGYEYAKDQYVVIDTNELEKLRSTDETKAIRIDTFVPPEKIDPIYYSETNYYLLPDGAAGQKSYALLHKSMVDEGVHCIAKIVLHNKEQLVLIRPIDNLLCMATLKYASQVKSPSDFSGELTETTVSEAEYALAQTLIEQTTVAEFDLAKYKDEYTQRLTQLIERKVAGEEVVATPAAESQQHVLSLMDALQASVGQPPPERETALAPVKSSRTKKKRAPAMPKAAKVGKKQVKAKEEADGLLADQLAKPKRKPAAKRKRKSG